MCVMSRSGRLRSASAASMSRLVSTAAWGAEIGFLNKRAKEGVPGRGGWLTLNT